MRALRWGWELLGTLQHDELVPPALAQRAEEIALRYPTPAALIELPKSDYPSLPDGLGETLDAARLLFQEVQFGAGGNPQTRRDAMFTLRHFPLQGSTAWAAAGLRMGMLLTWIEAEDR
jgi:hypothetical protein